MIERLRIDRLALVERLELEFGGGLNVLTGETGVGKSIVLGALSLLAGARARSDAVREGAESGVVEAVFDTRGLPELEAALAQRGLECEGHELIVRRSVSREGRSRAWVGGALVPIATLAELFAGRIEISSQHASQTLLRPESQSRLLDLYGGLLSDRERVAEGVRQLRARDEEIAKLRGAAEERARREDYLAYQVREIDEAELSPEEIAQCEAEHGRLVHAERLQSEAGQAVSRLLGDPGAPETRAAADVLLESARQMEALAELDAALAPLAERLLSLHTELADAAAEIERYAAGIEADPARLTRVEDRIAQFEKLRRKFGGRAGTVHEILAYRERAAAELSTLTGSDERLAELAKEREALCAEVKQAAQQLSAGRRRAAKSLAAAARESMRELALGEARFEVALQPLPPPEGLPCAGGGAESAEFLFSANPGESPRALRRVASGGELSRIFLALKNALRRTGAGMVLVFDEIDAGVGGAVAERIGHLLGALAGSHQVLCITHLPQIACQGGRHFRVSKESAEGRTRTGVAQLSEAERVDEIARMAGGERITEATRRHARALLSQSN